MPPSALHAAGTSCYPTPPGLVSWWRAEGDGADAVDGNDALLQMGTGFAAGKVGAAFSLDGVNDRITVPDAPNLRPATLTLEGWFYFDRIRTVVMVEKWAPNRRGWEMFLAAGTRQIVAFFHGTDGVSSNTRIDPGRWYHVAMTYDGAAHRLYVDGVLEQLQPRVIVIDDNAAANLTIGYSGFWNGNYVDGSIDEVALYDRALTGDEIASIHAAGTDGKCERMDVRIDALLGRDTDRLNLRSRAPMRVAILTTRIEDGEAVDFDASTVEPLSVRLGEASPLHSPTEPSFDPQHRKDVDEDGDIDLLLHFDPASTGIGIGDTGVCLQGKAGNYVVQGCDTIEPFDGPTNDASPNSTGGGKP